MRSVQRRHRRVLALGLAASSVIAGVALTSLEASGQKRPAKAAPDSGAPGAPGESRYDPDNITAISQAMETLVKGIEKYNAKDYTTAIDTFKKGIQLNPRHPLGHYLLGEAYLATSNLPEAEAAFKAAEEVSDSKNPLLRSHVLFAVADVYERQKKWEQASKAWQVYIEHAAKLGPDGGGFPQSGAARLKAVDEAIKLDKQYEIVRQRIAAEKDGGAADANKPAPTKK
ncbi:MAG: tetratricopeptide repeat protein [Labilithrix sp.]|nr:tetratricopeptide repeat protein [Labilithrix sp.]